jgi:hypothetical protein
MFKEYYAAFKDYFHAKVPVMYRGAAFVALGAILALLLFALI